MKISKKTKIKILIPILLICLYFFVPPIKNTVNQIFFLFAMLDVDAVKGYILSFGIWAPIVSFFLMVFQSVAAPLPAFLLTFANAALFGWVKGAILSWTSAMAGAALCFYIARYFGRDGVAKLIGKSNLETMDSYFEKYGKHTVIIARLLPFVSFDFVSYASGLTSMSLASFLIATGIGQLPATIVYSYVGGMLTGGTQLFVTGLLILFALSIAIAMGKQIWTNKRMKNDETNK